MNETTAQIDPNRLQEDMQALKDSLIKHLGETRKHLGLTQAELAERTGIARMTVQRAEAPETGTSLDTFLLLALALNLRPSLTSIENGPQAPLPYELVHRGVAHNRTQRDLQYRDRQRERAFSQAWEALNSRPLSTPLVSTLLDGANQAQASAAATVIQWLGSEVGFAFLTEALESAGYELQDTRHPHDDYPGKRSFFGRM